MEQKQINQMGIFTEDWNCCFNPKTPRSRRQRFSQSGPRISGFTAVFCDDWKDKMPENDIYRCTGKRKRRGYEKENIEYPFELGNATEDQHANSSQHKRQHKEPCCLPIQEFTPVIPNCQPIEYETWWPTSADSIASSFPSLETSVYDSDHASPSSRMPWDTAQEMSTFLGASPIGIEHRDDPGSYQSLLRANLSSPAKQNNTALSKGKYNESSPLVTEPSLDMKGFGYDHWAGLLDINMNFDCGLNIQSGNKMSSAELDRYLEELLQP